MWFHLDWGTDSGIGDTRNGVVGVNAGRRQGICGGGFCDVQMCSR